MWWWWFSAKSSLPLCDSMDYGLSGSSVHGIFQARIQEWVAISFSPGDLLGPGIEPASPAYQADSLPLSHQGNPIGVCMCVYVWAPSTVKA